MNDYADAVDMEDRHPPPRTNEEVLSGYQTPRETERNDNNLLAAPVKRTRNAADCVPEEQKRCVRRKLFSDESSLQMEDEESFEELRVRPTLHHIVYNREILDLRSPLPGHYGASTVLTNLFNTFVYIIRYKSTLLTLKNRKLSIELRSVEHRLRELEKDNYRGAHIHLPHLVESFFSMLDYRHNTIYINQLKPVSCVLDKQVMKDNISFRSMEATSKNNSNYIELMFHNPFRFIFVGCAKRTGMQNRNEVDMFQFFGEYMNTALQDMYDVLYELVSKEISRAKKDVADADRLEEEERAKRQCAGETATAALKAPPTNNLLMLNTFSKSKKNKNDDVEKLNDYLRAVKLPLTKKDTVDILITSGNSGKGNAEASKMSYLTVEINKDDPERTCLKNTDSDVTLDAVYLSSYIRCRVLLLEQSKFGLQVYTRHAIQLVSIDNRLVKFGELFHNSNATTEPSV